MKFSTNNFLHHLRQIITGGGRHSDGSPYIDSGYLKRAEGVNLTALSPPVAGAGIQQISFDCNLAAGPMAGTSAADLVTAYVPGYRFKLLALDFVTSVAGVGSSASQTLNLEIGTTNVTAGTCVVTEASTSAVGELTAGATITGANVGVATDSFSIEVAASGTAFTAGHGTLVVTLQNLDVVDALALSADETNARVFTVPANVDSVGNMVWQVPRDYDEATDIVTLRVLASQLTQSTDDDVVLDLEAYVKTAGSALGSDLDPDISTTVLSTTEQWIEFDLAGNSLNRDDVVTLELLTNGGNDTVGEEVLIHATELVYRSTLVSYDEQDSDGNDLR